MNCVQLHERAMGPNSFRTWQHNIMSRQVDRKKVSYMVMICCKRQVRADIGGNATGIYDIIAGPINADSQQAPHAELQNALRFMLQSRHDPEQSIEGCPGIGCSPNEAFCLRQAKPEKLMPEWEVLCAVAASVQNMHLMAHALGLAGMPTSPLEHLTRYGQSMPCVIACKLRMHCNIEHSMRPS